MKILFLFPALLAATQFVMPVFAETGSVAERDDALIKRYDTNGDGKLDEAEVTVVKERMFMADQEKREAKITRAKERQAALLKEFDQNADGKLDDAEKQTMETSLRARMERTPRMMKRLDTDADGKLSDLEWAAAREKIIGRLVDERKK
jgi:hypothetical protein